MKATVLVCAGLLVFSGLVIGQNSPLPLISSPLSPINAAPGGPALALTVNGANFTSTSVVHWNGSPRPTTFVSGAQLTASVSVADIATPATANITVVNPPPGGGTSNVAQFNVTTEVSGSAYKTVAMTNSYLPNLSADLNNDGKLDIVAISFNSSPGQLRVTLGNGDTTFQPALITTIENAPNAIAGGDFNQDGKYDIAIANTNGTVSVLLGSGDGTFQNHVDYPTGTTSTGVAVADLNGDGNADLVVANNVPSGTVSVLLGLGNGLFQPQIAYGAAPYTYSVALADFNQDGKVDIAVNGQDYAGILLGNGDGTFQHVALYLVREGASHSILAADVNSDGIQDLAVGGSSTVYILLGKGDGSFKMPSTAFTGGPVDSIVAGDFNEDGNLDFATSSSIRSSFYVLLGQGDGRTFHKYLSFGTGSAKPSLSIGDFNNDGYPDLCAGGAVLFQTTVAVKPTTLAFPDTYIGQSSAAQTVTLSNYAAAPLPITSITISSQGTSYSQTNTCGSSVPANGTCTVSVIFAPREAGLLTGTLKLEEPVLNSPQAVTLSGNALQRIVPMVTLDPPILTFGSQKVGTTSSPQFITLTNSGTAKLTISGIAASGDFAQTNTCGTTLLVDQNCTLIVTFTPNATGTRTGAITITDNAPGGTQSVPLTGTGTN